MERLVEPDLLSGTGYEWTGMAFQQKRLGGQVYLVFVMALMVVVMILAAQYESWIDPIAVITVVPLAVLGAIIGLAIRGLDLSMYTSRSNSARRSVGQERHPGRGVRQGGAGQRQICSGSGCGRSKTPFQGYRNDLLCIHCGSLSSGGSHGSRSREQTGGRHGGLLWNARSYNARDLFHSADVVVPMQRFKRPGADDRDPRQVAGGPGPSIECNQPDEDRYKG